MDSHFLGLVITDLLALDGSPGPAALTARTRNSYSVFSSKCGTVPLQSVAGTSAALIHLPESFSRFSMTYPVIGDPPSLIGGVHFKST